MDLKEIGKKLKDIREKQKIPMRKVADEIGVHYTYINKIENGQTASLDKLEKLCDYYNISITSLFGEEVVLPEELKEIGVEWITFSKEMQKRGLTPEKIKELLEAVKKLNNME